MEVDAAGRHSLQVVVRLAHLALGFVAEVVDTVPAVESAADLLICLNESLQLHGQVFVLSDQHVAVVLEGIDLLLNVGILALQGLVSEPEVILLTLGTLELLVGAAALALQIVQLSC